MRPIALNTLFQNEFNLIYIYSKFSGCLINKVQDKLVKLVKLARLLISFRSSPVHFIQLAAVILLMGLSPAPVFAANSVLVVNSDLTSDSDVTANSDLTDDSRISSINLAAEDSWPPFADQFGKGISHTLLKAAYGQVGIKVEYVVVPYSRGLRMAEKGNVDGVFNVAKEISTEDKFIFGQQPLFTTSASFYQSNQKPTSATHKSQLAPHTVVGIIEGYEYGDEFSKLVTDNQLTIFTATSQKQLINLLLVNRIDLAVMFDLVAKVHVSQMGAEQDISPAFSNHSSDIYVAFSKKSPNAHYLAQKLDEGLLKLKSQGQYATLLLPSAE
jgi:polar amino acid transport system substrate-binding protein